MTDQSLLHTYSVPGISCDHCRTSIETEVGGVDGVTHIAVDIAAKTVVVTGGDDAAIRSAIDDAGYDIA